MSEDQKSRKRLVPLAAKEDRMLAAMVSPEGEQGEVKVEIGELRSLEHGKAISPGASIIGLDCQEDGIFVDEIWRGEKPKPSDTARVGYSPAYSKGYDAIDWGHKPSDPTVN